MEVLVTLVNLLNGILLCFNGNGRLDVAKQVRGDIKETYNMGKFADPEYKHNEPDSITKRREEFIAFTKECFLVEQKVLVLFALALEVYSCKRLADLVTIRLFLQIPHCQGRHIQIYKVHSAKHSTRGNRYGCGCSQRLWKSHPVVVLFAYIDNNRFQDDVGGLQVLSKGEWVDATPVPDTIL